LRDSCRKKGGVGKVDVKKRGENGGEKRGQDVKLWDATGRVKKNLKRETSEEKAEQGPFDRIETQNKPAYFLGL